METQLYKDRECHFWSVHFLNVRVDIYLDRNTGNGSYPLLVPVNINITFKVSCLKEVSLKITLLLV